MIDTILIKISNILIESIYIGNKLNGQDDKDEDAEPVQVFFIVDGGCSRLIVVLFWHGKAPF